MRNRDPNILSLSLSAAAVLSALLWLFIGRRFIGLFASPDAAIILYFFLSGIVFSLGILGVVTFIKNILYMTEFVVEKDSLPLLVYRSVMEDDSEGVFFKDKKGRYLIINPIARKVLGLEGKNVIGARDQQLHESVLAHKIELEDKRVLEMGEAIVWEAESSTGLGREAFLCKKIPCYDSSGRTIGITGLCKNITILKTFQNLNVELEERYRQLFNRLPFPVLVLDVASMLPFTFNQSMSDLLGYSRQEFASTRFTVHTLEDSSNKLRSIISGAKRSGGGEFEITLKTKDKDLVDVIAYTQEIVLKDKKYLNIILHDITELKKSTNELINSELKYRSLFEHANDAILIIDIETLHIIDANDVALSFLDYSREDLKLLSVYDLDALSNHRKTQKKLNELEIYNHVLYEHEISGRKNQRYQVEINAHKVNYGNEEVYQYVIRNISERKKTQQALVASEQRYRQMFENNRAIKLVINPTKHLIEDANQAAAEFYGYSKQELLGMPTSQIYILGQDKLDMLIQASREQNLNYYTCPHKLANGDIRFVEVRDGIMDIDGQDLLYSIVHDVTASKHAEDQLLLASKMFDCSSDAAVITDAGKRVLSANAAFTRITGYHQSELLGQEPGMILAGRNETLLTESLLGQLDDAGQWQGEIWHRLKNGETRPLIATINIIKNDQGEVSNYMIFMTPVASFPDEKSPHKANYTSLTRLPNKALFADRMQYAIDRCQRAGKQLALLQVDFRNFSTVNERYGFDVGDDVLKAIARRLQYNVRESDCVGHFAADNFAVFLEDLTDVQQAGIVAQKIISTLEEGYQLGDREIQLEVSIGISITPGDGVVVDRLMDKSALALKNAQHSPGSQFRFCSSELDANTHAWLQTEQRLHSSLRHDELFITYLPQFNTQNNNRLEALEALVRWQYDADTVVMPEQFLPTAAQSGFIGLIGQKVMDKALAQFSDWIARGMPSTSKLHINLCLSQLDEDLLPSLVSCCDKHKLPYNVLMLDFTESKFVCISQEQRNLLVQLHDKGFGICIDDFGSDVASLSVLLQCPVDAIKIDPAVVARSRYSAVAMNLLKGMLALADTFDIDVIAEGIETENQFKQLKQLGCHHMQGHYFSKPLIPEDVPQLFNMTEETL